MLEKGRVLNLFSFSLMWGLEFFFENFEYFLPGPPNKRKYRFTTILFHSALMS
jgi:hypothetical protein